MIKWEHSVFALPFALCGAMLAARGLPTLRQLLWIIVAMVAARSAAMSFNRLADASQMRPTWHLPVRFRRAHQGFVRTLSSCRRRCSYWPPGS
jgi:hypothetical protein